MLTRGALARHEASLKRRLMKVLVAYAVIALGFLTQQEGIVIVGLLATYVIGWGLFMFMWKDIELRGRSGLWAFLIGSTPLGIVVWLVWRRANPIRTP
jgi:hypothetical protein